MFALFSVTKEVIHMTNQERFKKYKQEYCKRCKNKTTDLCNIRVFTIDKTIYTKYVFYERNKE